MEKKTMGAFIAALRKANGMTQQELADKLNISNKAVSRWERDECAPDISLIPALAEILGVTCDELLKGERILSNPVQEKSEPKVEKQVKALINRAISNFKTLIWISFGLSAVGLICMFGISYGAFRPLIGFIIMCLFAVSAFVISAIGTNKLKEKKSENELFENAEETIIERYNDTLKIYSYSAFCSAISAVVLSIPYLFYLSSYYVNSVLKFSDYFKLFWWLVPALMLLFYVLKDRYFAWITGKPYEKRATEKNSKLILMSFLQITVAVLSGVLFLIAPYFVADKVWSVEDMLLVMAYFLLPASAIIFAVYIIVGKSERKKFVLPGIRNLLFCSPALLMKGFHYSILYYPGPGSNPVIHQIWDIDYFLTALGTTITIFLLFKIINSLKKEV